MDRWRRTRVSLPSLGERDGGVTVRADTEEGVAEIGQAGGEGVGFL